MKKTAPFIFQVLAICLLLAPLSGLQARDLTGRLGIGMTNTFVNGQPGISIKLQRAPTYAFGVVLGARFTSSDHGAMAGGFKFYRMIFDEPNLNFYAAGMAALINTRTPVTNDLGLQFDALLGTEFHFSGLDSLGFSFEFGVTVSRLHEEFTLETVGHSLIRAAVHFYL